MNRLPHAVLLAGGSEDDARELAAAYNCLSDGGRPCGECLPCVKTHRLVHPDVTAFDCTGAKVEQIRDLTAEAHVLPNEGRRKVFVMLNAGELSVICQNALLKVLEEPPSHTVFIMTADSTAAFLPTVRSRLTVWGVSARTQAERQDTGGILGAYDSGDELKLLLAALACDKLDRDSLGALIDSVREGLLERRALGAVERLGSLRQTLERNTGVGHVCGAMAAILAEDIRSIL